MLFRSRGLRPKAKLQSHAGPAGHRTSPFPTLWVCALRGADAAVRAALAAESARALTYAARASELPAAMLADART